MVRGSSLDDAWSGPRPTPPFRHHQFEGRLPFSALTPTGARPVTPSGLRVCRLDGVNGALRNNYWADCSGGRPIEPALLIGLHRVGFSGRSDARISADIARRLAEFEEACRLYERTEREHRERDASAQQGFAELETARLIWVAPGRRHGAGRRSSASSFGRKRAAPGNWCGAPLMRLFLLE
jgi:hypothetical protein